LLMCFYIVANKEYLMKRQLIFRYVILHSISYKLTV